MSYSRTFALVLATLSMAACGGGSGDDTPPADAAPPNGDGDLCFPLPADGDGDTINDSDAGKNFARDTDGDGLPDFRETDADGNGIPAQDELGDFDGDGIPDFADRDDDGDNLY